MAVIYGQQGKMDLMIDTFLEEAYTNQNNTIMIQNQLSRFMTEEAEETFNTALRKALLVRAQKNQDIFWNQFLSWFLYSKKIILKHLSRKKQSTDVTRNLFQIS